MQILLPFVPLEPVTQSSVNFCGSDCGFGQKIDATPDLVPSYPPYNIKSKITYVSE
jgi:hypothetical protein